GKSLLNRASHDFDRSAVPNKHNNVGCKYKQHYKQNGRGSNKYYKKHFTGNSSFKKNGLKQPSVTGEAAGAETTDTKVEDGRFDNPPEGRDEGYETNEVQWDRYLESPGTTTCTAAASGNPLNSPPPEDQYQLHFEAALAKRGSQAETKEQVSICNST